MSGLLSVVATPIGNLEDVTLRALRVLRAADLVAAEDTRHTAKLLRHHGIDSRMISFHAHNSRSRLPQLLEGLVGGTRVALVTDAGTPGISDPGVELVHACRERGVQVEVLPGPSASLTAAVASGFPLNPLTFAGFPPTRAKDRHGWFTWASSLQHTVTFFEAPHRIASTLRDCAMYFGKRHICVARELTKAYEEVSLFVLNDQVLPPIKARGEFTLVVGPAAPDPEHATPGDAEILARFREVSAGLGGTRREALGRVARELGVPKSAVYAAMERAKRSE